MNRIRINRVDELIRWYRDNAKYRGVHLIETSLTEGEITCALYDEVTITSLRLYNHSMDQSFNESLVLSLSHKVNDCHINSLVDSLLLGSKVSNVSIINQILFRCLSVLDSERNRFILLDISGFKSKVTDDDLLLLENAIEEQKNTFVVILVIKRQTQYHKSFNMNDSGKLDKVHISYKHLSRYEKQIESIYNSLVKAGIGVSIDKHELEVRDSIKEYEIEIGQSKQVIVVITPEYLRSIQCMFELKEIIKNGDICRRLTVIAELDGIQRNSDGLREIKNYWQEQKCRKADMIKSEIGQIKMLASEIEIINDIIIELDDAWLYLSQNITGAIDEMCADNASKLVKTIKKAINEDIAVASLSPLPSVSGTTSSTLTPPMREIHQGDKSVYVENLNGDIIIN